MNALITAVASETAIPVNVIQAIIAAIMNIIAMCNPTPAPTPAEVKTASSFRWNNTVLRGMLMVSVHPLSMQGRAVLASIQKNAGLLADADASEFLTQCGVLAPVSEVKEMPKA